MIDEDSASEAVKAIRRGLAEKGDAGRFLLGEIDRALAPGVEEVQDEFVESSRGRSRRSGKKVVVRRAPDAVEALLTHVRVMKAFLVDADLAAESAMRDLAAYAPIERIVVTFRTDFEYSAVQPQEPNDIPLGDKKISMERSTTEQELLKLEAMILGKSKGETDAPAN